MEPPNTPGNKKKSNNLGGRTGTAKVHSVYGRTLRHSQGTEYLLIIRQALAYYYEGGREPAIDYLSSQRSWLQDYIGSTPLPSSGELLDWLLEHRLTFDQSPSHRLFQRKRNK